MSLFVWFIVLNWQFLINVLQNFGFNYLLCNRISIILYSTKLFAMIMARLHVTLLVLGGETRKNIITSTLLHFFKEVLLRKMTHLVNQGHLTCITYHKTIISRYNFFANDLLIFCKDTMKMLTKFINFCRNTTKILVNMSIKIIEKYWGYNFGTCSG